MTDRHGAGIEVIHDHGRNPDIRSRSAMWAAPVVLGLGVLLIYLRTLTQVHTFDALSYVTSVERKPWTEVFHPHHLAYGPLGTLTLALSKALGYTGGAAIPLQLVNAATGALGVALFFSIVWRVTRRADIALPVALLLGGAYAYWFYAVEIEVYTVAVLFLILCLAILTRPGAPSRRSMLLLGLAHGGAVLFHQTNVLLGAPVLAALLLHSREHPSTTPTHQLPPAAANPGWAVVIRRSAVYLLALALTVALPYLFVGVVVSGFRSWNAFADWMTKYARTGWWGGPITTQKWIGLGIGLADTLAQPGGALFWLLLVGLVVIHLRRLIAGPRRLVVPLVIWLLVYGAFFLWWEPDNIEFWIASLPPALLLLALALSGERRWGPGIWITVAVAVTAAGVNYASISRRGDPTTDLQRTIARALGTRSQNADLLLVPDGLLELYLPYYEGHDNFRSLNQALLDAGGDWGQACANLQTGIETSLHAGAAVLLAEEVLHPPPLLLQRHRLTQANIDSCFAPYHAALRPIPDLLRDIPAYWRLPTGQEHASSEGWRFDHFDEGWQATNVRDSRFASGWRFTPGTDPALTSPLLNLDSSRYQAIEIRIANATQAHDAQLFYAGTDQQFTEAHALRWTLKPTMEVVTYRLELRGAPGWQGRITRLRIDPVGVGDGGELRVVWIRLIS